MKATSVSSSISANLGNSRESKFTSIRSSNVWPPHFHTFCELVEGEENKLTTFSTWTIMLGCNESNIGFQQRNSRESKFTSIRSSYHTFVLFVS